MFSVSAITADDHLITHSIRNYIVSAATFLVSLGVNFMGKFSICIKKNEMIFLIL